VGTGTVIVFLPVITGCPLVPYLQLFVFIHTSHFAKPSIMQVGTATVRYLQISVGQASNIPVGTVIARNVVIGGNCRQLYSKTVMRHYSLIS